MSQDATDNTIQVAVDCLGPDVVTSNTELDQVGPYKIVRKIGQGAMGAVFLAEHANLKRSVALKILPPELAVNPTRRDRFHREMAAIGRLEHENIVLATDAGQADGYFYIAMQYVDGFDLDELLDRVHRVETRAACEIVRQAASGLQHIHENKLVHRDIKPSNIVITRDGDVKILDLGIAMLCRDECSDAGLTSADALMGTPDFMAPEQIHQCRMVDIRADIYSLGCTLYTLLSGQVPFSGSEYESYAAKLIGHAEHDPTPLGQLCPDLPPALLEIVEQMMAKSPDDRPNSPQAVADMLADWSGPANLTKLLDGNAPPLAPVRQVKHGQRASAQKKSRRRTHIAGLSFGMMLGLAGYFLLPFNSAPTLTTPLDDIASKAGSIQVTAEGIAGTNASIAENTEQIAQTLAAMRDRFEGFEENIAIAKPASAGDFYHNARVFSQKGDYRAARESFLQYFQIDLDVVDPHLRFIEFLKLQEGLAGAHEIYRGLPGDERTAARRFATAMLQDPATRRQLLTKLTVDDPEFAPAFFQLSREYSLARLGQQSFEDKRQEKALLNRFLELHKSGHVVRHYLDQTDAIASITDAEQRLNQQQWYADSVLENPVSFSVAMPVNDEWMIILQIADACTDILYRVGETGEYVSTGTDDRFTTIDPRTGKKMPRHDIRILDPGRKTIISVMYVDINGTQQGPFKLDFDPAQTLVDLAVSRLKAAPQDWIRFHRDRAVYFDLFQNWRTISELRYSYNDESLAYQRQVPQADWTDANQQLYLGIDVPDTVSYIAVQLTFIDGTKSEILRYSRLE